MEAAIGFGGAIVGAVVGGMFVLYAARSQRKHEQDDASHRASSSILAALPRLDGVFATWLSGAGMAAEQIGTAFNAFSTTVIADLPFITDDHVRTRVNAHVDVCHALLLIAVTKMGQSPPPTVLEATRRHADAVASALEAHIRGIDLPTYEPIPHNEKGAVDLTAFTRWPDSQ